LLREVMNPEVGSVHSQALGFHGEVNGLQEASAADCVVTAVKMTMAE